MPRAIITENNKKKAERLLADTYAMLAHMEYNLAGHMYTEPLVKMRKAIKLLGLDINQHLPDECPKL